ncbi:MAG: DNA translocase FtsK 4TM domain-containing protein [Lachnospiraceae bacterium]|nr:DNA translocase FtsK 4TM domain-containing protein [Lachnospiraceae bacterium]
MAARKGSTGTSAGGSGKSNTKKSTAAKKTSGTGKKTSGTAKKASAGSSRKTQTKSGTAGRSSAKRTAGGAGRKNTAGEQNGSGVRSEISILTALALTLFGTLSVFGLCGSAGAVVRDFLYGVFGILACVVPLLFFLAVMFFVSNLGNGKAMGKLLAGLLIVPDLCGLIQLIVSPHATGETLKELYASGTGGGWLGGAVKQGLCSVFDVVGAYLILVLILLICLVVITEKSLTRWLRAAGEQILGRARDDYDYRVEQNEENRARNEEKKEEQRIQREERRRLAEERRRQEEERREERRRQEEEHRRRTDHKVRGVEIRDNTVIGETGTEDAAGRAAGGGNDRVTAHAAGDETGGMRSRSEDSETDGRRGHAADSETDGSRKGRAGDSETDSRKGRAADSETDDSRKGRAADSETDDNRKVHVWDREPEGAADRVTDSENGSRAGDGRIDRRSPPENPAEDPAEDAAVEWWNPHETEEPVPEDVIDRLERELKYVEGSEPESDRNGFRDGQDTPGDESAGQQTGLVKEEPEDEDRDGFSDGVRRLDFMQERVNRRMKEFETVKADDAEGENISQSEFSAESDHNIGERTETDNFTDRRAEAEIPSDTAAAAEASIGVRTEEEASAGVRTGPETFAGTKTGTEASAGVRTGTETPAGAKTSAEVSSGRKNGTGLPGSSKVGTGTSSGTKTGAGTDVSGAAPRVLQYRKPPTSLLTAGGRSERDSQAELNRVADKLQDTLKRFGVNVTITDVSRGPSVTRYELLPEAGTRVNRITSLSDDIKLALAATDIRIEAPIPGKSAIGIEVPNRRRETVYLKDLVESGELKGHPSKIAFAAGKDIAGKVIVADIAKMPHMLIAGTTGSGKSVFTNSIIMTILFRATPEEVKLIIIDPKVVEFGIYNGIPHLMTPVVTDPRKAAEALKWATAEMSRRYQTFANENVRDLKGYNKKIEREHLTDKDGQPLKKLPQIVIIIDELADLMMVAAKDVEETICRLAQLARAAGIHLIIATQRPSVDVVTGLIKANIPSRVALLVSSGTDSRTIIDMNGAEKLLGNGDMLFAPSGYAKPVRLQGAFVSDEEVRSVVEFLKKQVPEGGACDPTVFEEVETAEQEEAGENRNEQDELFADAGRFLIEKKRASVSLLQRKFRVGFNRAARIIDQLEEAGVVGEELGTKPRNVLMTLEEFEELLKTQG